jgi:hypothetical protein
LVSSLEKDSDKYKSFYCQYRLAVAADNLKSEEPSLELVASKKINKV